MRYGVLAYAFRRTNQAAETASSIDHPLTLLTLATLPSQAARR